MMMGSETYDSVFSNITLTSTESTAHCHNYTSTEEVYFYANVLALLFIIALGFVGNSLVIAVHCIDPSKNSSSVLLLALAVFDNILLLNGLFGSVLYSTFPYTGSGHWFWDYKDYFTLASHPIFYWALTCSTWCIVLVTLDRYIVVSRPLRASTICTVRRARCYVIALACLAVIYNLPRVFEHEIRGSLESCTNETSWRKEKTTLGRAGYYQLGYAVILFVILNYLVPLVLLLTLNGLLMRHINHAMTHHSPSSNKPKLRRHSSSSKLAVAEESINRMVVCIIVRFIICITPGLALRFLIILNDPVLDTYEIFSNLLIYINSSTNFIIFTAMGKRFRRIMMTSLCKTKQRQRKDRRQSSMASLELIRSISSSTIRKDNSVISTDNSLYKSEVSSCAAVRTGYFSDVFEECICSHESPELKSDPRKLTRCVSWALGDHYPECNSTTNI